MPQSISAYGATRINVGLSALIKVQAGANNCSQYLKIISGGGTLEIVNLPVALTGSSAAGWGAGYPVGASEVVSLPGAVTYYLAATGATMVAAVANAYTPGITLI